MIIYTTICILFNLHIWLVLVTVSMHFPSFRPFIQLYTAVVINLFNFSAFFDGKQLLKLHRAYGSCYFQEISATHCYATTHRLTITGILNENWDSVYNIHIVVIHAWHTNTNFYKIQIQYTWFCQNVVEGLIVWRGRVDINPYGVLCWEWCLLS